MNRLAHAGLLAVAASCSVTDPDARIDPVGPSRADFAFVSPVLSRRCGSVDCHGSTFRNLRVWGYGGQRLDATATPDVPASNTDDEITATYDAVVGLEPEIMRRVVEDRGLAPERLTFVRKARGDEAHAGGRRITPGDAADRCISSWLANTTRTEDCDAAGCVVRRDGGASIEQCR